MVSVQPGVGHTLGRAASLEAPVWVRLHLSSRAPQMGQVAARVTGWLMEQRATPLAGRL